MQLVERHLVKSKNKYFSEIDRLAFASKNIYNKTQYFARQHFFETGKMYSYADIYHIVKTEPEYRFLPTKVSQQTIKLVAQNWTGWLGAIRAYYKAPAKFLGKPKIPKYLNKDGRQVVTYTKQAISFVNPDYIRLSQTDIKIKTRIPYENINQVRLVPKGTCYVIEVIYEKELTENDLDYGLVAGIDLGLNNLATITSNKHGYVPFFVNGRPLKAINQMYNKTKAKLQSQLPPSLYTSSQIKKVTERRNRRIDHFLHVYSRWIIDDLVQHGIGNLVIGRNKNWKQDINIGKRNNQNFVSIPFYRFVQMLSYKAEMAGIIVYETEESYTSKCSFLDNESIGKHEEYLGRRVKRGLFKSAKGILINADVNGSYNIIKKVFPDVNEGLGDVVVHPVKVNLRTRKICL